MDFDDNAKLDTSQVTDARGGGGRFSGVPGGGIAVGGGGLGIIGLLIVVLINVVGGGASSDSSGLAGQFGDDQAVSTADLSQECRTGADADNKADCRIVGIVNSVQSYWATQLQGRYSKVPTLFFSGQVQTRCGAATADVGPFYCPGDRTVYIDLGFFDDLQSKFGAKGGPFAEAYVIAHEYGHHVQDVQGTIARVDKSGDRTGPESQSVRLELQADCYAGLWAHAATTTPYNGGKPLISNISKADITDGLDAAAAVGDDRIQQEFSGEVSSDSWTHGSAAARQRWFTTGFRTGSMAACNTFTGSVE